MSDSKDFSEYKLTVRVSDHPSYKLAGSRHGSGVSANVACFTEEKGARSTRAVICYKCGQISLAADGAFSSLCKHCGVHMNLEDFSLSPYSKKKLVETHGDVYIQPGGNLTGMTIRCRNLIMDGWADGQLYCQGSLILNQSGSIRGIVQANRLKVSRRAKVAFLENVYLRTAEVDGEVTGNLFCEGIVSLGENAVLVGDVTANTLILPLGAVFKGNYRINKN